MNDGYTAIAMSVPVDYLFFSDANFNSGSQRGQDAKETMTQTPENKDSASLGNLSVRMWTFPLQVSEQLVGRDFFPEYFEEDLSCANYG